MSHLLYLSRGSASLRLRSWSNRSTCSLLSKSKTACRCDQLAQSVESLRFDVDSEHVDVGGEHKDALKLKIEHLKATFRSQRDGALKLSNTMKNEAKEIAKEAKEIAKDAERAQQQELHDLRREQKQEEDKIFATEAVRAAGVHDIGFSGFERGSQLDREPEQLKQLEKDKADAASAKATIKWEADKAAAMVASKLAGLR